MLERLSMSTTLGWRKPTKRLVIISHVHKHLYGNQSSDHWFIAVYLEAHTCVNYVCTCWIFIWTFTQAYAFHRLVGSMLHVRSWQDCLNAGNWRAPSFNSIVPYKVYTIKTHYNHIINHKNSKLSKSAPAHDRELPSSCGMLRSSPGVSDGPIHWSWWSIDLAGNLPWHARCKVSYDGNWPTMGNIASQT